MAKTLYVLDGCGYCQQIQRQLDEGGESYRLVDLSKRRQAVAELRKLTGGRRIVPVLVDGGEVRIAPDGGTEF